MNKCEYTINCVNKVEQRVRIYYLNDQGEEKTEDVTVCNEHSKQAGGDFPDCIEDLGAING